MLLIPDKVSGFLSLIFWRSIFFIISLIPWNIFAVLKNSCAYHIFCNLSKSLCLPHERRFGPSRAPGILTVLTSKSYRAQAWCKFWKLELPKIPRRRPKPSETYLRNLPPEPTPAHAKTLRNLPQPASGTYTSIRRNPPETSGIRLQGSGACLPSLLVFCSINISYSIIISCSFWFWSRFRGLFFFSFREIDYSGFRSWKYNWLLFGVYASVFFFQNYNLIFQGVMGEWVGLIRRVIMEKIMGRRIMNESV